MTDRYQHLVNTPIGKLASKQIGLPTPPRLERFQAGQPVVSGPVLLGTTAGGRLGGALAGVLASAGADGLTAMDEPLRTAAAAPGGGPRARRPPPGCPRLSAGEGGAAAHRRADAGLEAGIFNPEATTEDQR